MKGFGVSPVGPVVMQLQFADDNLFFCEPCRSELLGFQAIFHCFELVSGLHINLGKSTLIGVRVEEESVRDWACEVGCRVGKLPFTYLGLPVEGNPRLKKFWSPIIEKMERRLEGWGRKYLSMGGRLTLIKSVLANLTLYYLSLIELPKGVARKMETLSRKFLWGDREEKREIHSVPWSEVTKPKSKGGLGVVPLQVRNEALLCKWGWRFSRERDSLWVRVLTTKYGVENENGWSLGEGADRSGSRILKSW